MVLWQCYNILKWFCPRHLLKTSPDIHLIKYFVVGNLKLESSISLIITICKTMWNPSRTSFEEILHSPNRRYRSTLEVWGIASIWMFCCKLPSISLTAVKIDYHIFLHKFITCKYRITSSTVSFILLFCQYWMVSDQWLLNNL